MSILRIRFIVKMVPPVRIERTTFRLQGGCCYLLSYRGDKKHSGGPTQKHELLVSSQGASRE